MSSQSTDRRQRISAGAAGVIDAAIDRPDKASGQRASQPEEVQENRQTLVDLLPQMLLIRRFEENSAESKASGHISPPLFFTTAHTPSRYLPLPLFAPL